MVVVSPNSFTDAPWPLVNSLTMPPIAPKVRLAPALLMVSISFRFLFSSTLTLVPSLLTLIFLSPLKSTVSPGLTLVASVVTPLVDKFQPALAVSLTFFSWLTFTASLSERPSVTPPMLPSCLTCTLPLMIVVLSRSSTDALPLVNFAVAPKIGLELSSSFAAPLLTDSIPFRSLFRAKPSLSTTRLPSPAFSLTEIALFSPLIAMPLPSV